MSNKDPKILLVEDEPSIRYVAERQFKALGYRITDMAEDGLSAVRKATENDYDLIFMDLRLPALDGLSATKQIREAGKDTVIIGMTAFAHKKECMEAGMDDFLQKPVLLQQLEDALTRWLQKERTVQTTTRIIELPPPEVFKQTQERLDHLRSRIIQLRKNVGLQ